jgi:hypothetical protein
MIERITYRDVRDTAGWEERNHPGCSGSWLFDLADQMETDEKDHNGTATLYLTEANRRRKAEFERDAALARVVALIDEAQNTFTPKQLARVYHTVMATVANHGVPPHITMDEFMDLIIDRLTREESR